MREIKFRVWIEEEKTMIDVPIIDFREKGKIKTTYSSPCGEWEYNFDEIELMQFTGLYDKNKVPIYEGDIVIFEDCEMSSESGYGDTFINQGVVEYNNENCCFNVTERITVELVDVLYKDNETLEVIGNIYDNPDLLGE